MDNTNPPQNIGVWVLAEAPDQGCLERLGDAARLAQAMGCGVGVGLVQPKLHQADQGNCLQKLFQQGANFVCVVKFSVSPTDSFQRPSPNSLAMASIELLKDRSVKVIFVGGDGAAREWGSLLAAELVGDWISPVLMTRFRAEQLQITRLDQTGRQACQIASDLHRPVIVSIRDGVAEALLPSADQDDTGVFEELIVEHSATTRRSTHLPVDASTADIRDCKKLISGGRGLGSATGFDLLRRVAVQLDAGVAASRLAVDQGWIEYDKQVGQTGKTVQPDLYIACGISGASHHLDGMSSAKHIVAINSDPAAPIMQVAHLKLAADLFETLQRVSEKLEHRAGQPAEVPR